MSRPPLLSRFKAMTERSLHASRHRDLGASGGLFSGLGPEPELEPATPPSEARQEAVQRLQIGFFGIAAMVLLVGLASIIGNQAELTKEEAVPEAAPTTEPSPTPTQANPLADAGVVPDIAADPTPAPSVPLDLPPPSPSPGNAAP